MHTKTALFTGITLSLAMTLIGVPKAHAMWMQQSQSSSNTFTSDCTGTCHVTGSSSMSQDQAMSSGQGGNWATNGRDWGDTNSWMPDTSGQATVSWGFRGVTCTIRYTEATSRVWHYSTATACDNGQLTIGGLVAGRAYRFQVRNEAGNVSRAVRIVAN